MKTIKEVNLTNKRVLIRADLNVPLSEDGIIADPNRIKQFLPTLKHVIENNGKAIVMSHLGRPDGQPNPKASLKPTADYIREVLKVNVTMAPDCIGDEVENLVEKLQAGEVLVLENLRFHKGEKTADPEFCKKLAKLADVYIGDAFATAHRAHASMVGVPNLIKEKAAGYLMQNEINYFEKALLKPARPLCVILGGAKISSKLPALQNISDKADKIIIGGAMANTFLAAQGNQMGRSLFEQELFQKSLELLGTLARRDCKVYLPVDFMVGPSLSAKGLGRPVPAQEVPADMMALDIGPATSILYKEAIQTAETILWNGPMGAFENEDYSKGTTDMIENIASSHAISVVGGGDTDAAIHQMELTHKFSYLSTGGGAFLELLEGKKLPGVEILK